MARGLSELQQTILKMVANSARMERNRQLEVHRVDGVDGFNLARIERSWIFCDYYGEGAGDRAERHPKQRTESAG